MAVPKVYPKKANIVVDIETLDTAHNAATIDIAAVSLYEVEGLPRYFNVKIKPSQYLGHAAFSANNATRDFHEKQNPGYVQECEEIGLTIQEAALALFAFMQSYNDVFELHCWSQGKDFDFPILSNFMKVAELDVPWNYGKVHCLRDLVWLNPKCRIYPEAGSVKHKALPDAVFEARQLHEVVQSNSWYQRLMS
ncbi:MAG: hypothetical protein [Bacteriophage sp.]|nr:MAG: hypothetical protein [Bacteriophage sp.]